MYNTNLQDMGYQTLNQNYDSPISVYKNLDSLVGNYSSNDHGHEGVAKSDFLKFATHEPFTCGCEYHNDQA